MCFDYPKVNKTGPFHKFCVIHENEARVVLSVLKCGRSVNYYVQLDLSNSNISVTQNHRKSETLLISFPLCLSNSNEFFPLEIRIYFNENEANISIV